MIEEQSDRFAIKTDPDEDDPIPEWISNGDHPRARARDIDEDSQKVEFATSV